MNDNVKKFLMYTGIIGSVISAIAYIVTTAVMVMGFSSKIDQDKQLLFSILGALVGLMITFFLRSQGVSFASKEEESQKVMKAYHEKINKTKTVKQLHTIKHYMVMQTIKDVIVKGLTVAVSTWFVLYIFMEGNGDYGLFLLAVSNILLFACFGIMALSKAYDKYIEEHIPAIKEIIKKLDQVGSIPLKEKENANLQQRELSISTSTSRDQQEQHRRNSELPGNIRGQSVLNYGELGEPNLNT